MYDALDGDGGAGGVARRYDGWAELLVSHELTSGDTAAAAIRLALVGLPGEWDGMLDTGAQWSILPYEVAQQLHIKVEGRERRKYHTRRGDIWGVRVKHSVVLAARDGQGIDVDATWFVSEEWLEPMMVGWYGFLEGIAFGCDPGREAGDEPKFFFAEL